MLKLIAAIFLVFATNVSANSVYPSQSEACSRSASYPPEALELIKVLSRDVPTHLPSKTSLGIRWARTQDRVTDMLGMDSVDLLITNPAELRFLPYTLPHSSVLAIFKRDKVLNENRLTKVLSVAKMLKIKISVLWLGKGNSPQLEELANSSGGLFVASRDIIKGTCLPLVMISHSQ